jgi:ParB/RepB/Spo0J family partition protein
MGHQAMVAVAKIVVPAHRRRRHERTELEATKASIAELGIEQPLRLAETKDGVLELVAGEGRLICARELGLKEVPALIKPADPMKDVAGRAAENFAREDLSLLDEAEEIKALIDVGHRPKQVQAITGRSAKLITARLVLVALPQELRNLYGPGGLSADSVAGLKELYDACPAIALAVGKAAEREPQQISEYLANDRPYLLKNLAEVMKKAGVSDAPPFIASLRRGNPWWRKLTWTPSRSCPIKLKGEAGKWFRKYWESCNQYDRPAIPLTDEDLDQAVAVGVAFADKGEYGNVWIHDLAWLNDHINDIVLPRMRKDTEAAAARRAKQAQGPKVDPANLAKADKRTLANRLLGKFTRALKPRAHQANLDLGYALKTQLGSVELTKEVATFFAYEVLGRPSARHAYAGNPSRARVLADCCARTFPDWIKVDKKTLKSGVVRETPVYLDGEQAEQEMWKYIDAAKTPQEILGRTLVVFATAARFQRECGANGKTPHHHKPANPAALKAFEKLIAKALPASLKRLEREKTAYDPMQEAEQLIAKAKREEAATEKAKDTGKTGGDGTVVTLPKPAAATKPAAEGEPQEPQEEAELAEAA